MGTKGKGPILRASKEDWLSCLRTAVGEGKMGGNEEDSKDKKLWSGVMLQSCREDVEKTVIMQYAQCRQIGGLGPSSFLISDSERKPLFYTDRSLTG